MCNMSLSMPAPRIALLLFAYACRLALAQNPTATLVGTVTDPSGAAVTAAKVEIRNTATNGVRKTETGPKGEFMAPDLQAGIYEVSITKPGFETLLERQLELQIDQEARIAFHLRIGSVSQTLQISATTPLVNTENSVKGDVVVRNEMLQMPLNGRDFTDLAMLTAGVSPNYQGNWDPV